eukprot:15084057-Alexandrium_andersonii.AAC.1
MGIPMPGRTGSRNATSTPRARASRPLGRSGLHATTIMTPSSSWPSTWMISSLLVPPVTCWQGGSCFARVSP